MIGKDTGALSALLLREDLNRKVAGALAAAFCVASKAFSVCTFIQVIRGVRLSVHATGGVQRITDPG